MYWNLDIEEVFRKLNSSNCGLSSDEARIRLAKNGPNRIEKEKRTSLFLIFLNQFRDPLIYLLIIAGIFTLFIGEYIDASVIAAILLTNAVVGFIQEFRAEKAMEAIRKLAAGKAVVIRQCQRIDVDAEELVDGDVLLLSAGDKVPADSRIFEAKELKVDESILTGESRPVHKKTSRIDDKRPDLADISNYVFMGSNVTTGRAKAVVVATAERSELGKISERVKSVEKEKTPLQKKMAVFTNIIGVATVALSLLVFFVGLSKGVPFRQMIVFSISMAVSAIPEGLPIVVTVAMAIGLTRMARKNVIIRKLVAVETLGSCNYICSDKTGTITQNRMTVIKAYANRKEFDFEDSGYLTRGAITLNGQKVEREEDLRMLLLAGVLCNDARLKQEQGSSIVQGDPMEGALIVSARKFGIGQEEQDSYPRRQEVPFESEKKYMAVAVEKEKKCLIFVKGAPEIVLKFCAKQADEQIEKEYEKFTGQGLRVLAFAMKEIKRCPQEDQVDAESKSGAKFLGFQAMLDPPRQEAIESIKKTKVAGITTVMITGDNKKTAQTIARNTGILSPGGLSVTGRELEEDPGFLENNVERIEVYARVSPEHKLKIIEALKKKGKVVAMTGDGVNDAPALKRADIGVSMGRAGTDVAREASDMILRDDNFASIVEAIRQGRIIFDNIRKVTMFLLCSAAGEIIAIISSLFLNLPLPFMATQILWINVVTNGLQDVALAFEPGEEKILQVPPRDPKEKIVNVFLFRRLLLTGLVLGAGTLFMLWLKLKQGYSLQYSRTTAFNTMVFFQFFNLLNWRSFTLSVFKNSLFKNNFLFISMITALIAQLAVLNVPGLQFLFKTTALDMPTWLELLAVSSSIIFIIEADKFFVQRSKSRKIRMGPYNV